MSLVLTETDLLKQCEVIQGITFSEMAYRLGLILPETSQERKGFVGQCLERLLGTTAGNKPCPDFIELGIELKTLPLNHLGLPAESTFVTTIPLLTIGQQQWKTSTCYQKLARVLWIPIEGDKAIPFPMRRIGQPILWSPSKQEEAILQDDFEEITTLIRNGQLNEINANLGQALQVRPKGASGKSLCEAYNEAGDKVQTLPRGFYLRTLFTKTILK
jgi:DNA mismatch repair protein MutH